MADSLGKIPGCALPRRRRRDTQLTRARAEDSVASSRQRAEFAHHMGCGYQRAKRAGWWGLSSQELAHLTHVHAVKVTSQNALNYITPFLVEALGL